MSSTATNISISLALLFSLVAAISSFLPSTMLSKILRKRRDRVVGIIPARFASVRFPGKPLAEINGKPMILHTVAQAKQAKSLDMIVVATDDQRIADVCKDAGVSVIYTSSDCANGSERCAEAASKLDQQFDVVVNIQGDEPLVDPASIDSVVRALQDTPDAVYSTACCALNPEDAALRQRVKCIVDTNGYALYFSRAVLPHNKEGQAKAFPEPFSGSNQYLLHLGIQCYDSAFLHDYAYTLPATPLMVMEDLEQLKVLEHGYRMKVVVVEDGVHGVDTPEDLISIEKMLKEKSDGLGAAAALDESICADDVSVGVEA